MARLARPENKSSCHIFFCVLWARLALAATVHKAQARPLREGWGAGVLEQHTGWTERGPETRQSQPEGTCGEKRPQPQHGDATAGFSSRAEGVALAWAGVLHNGQGEETVWTRTESDGAWKPWGTVTCADWTVTDA